MGLCFFKRHISLYMMKKKWQDELKGKLFFPHGHSNSGGVAIGFLGNMNFNVLNKIQDNDWRILILDIQVDGAAFLLIILYNANKECKKLSLLTTLVISWVILVIYIVKI